MRSSICVIIFLYKMEYYKQRRDARCETKIKNTSGGRFCDHYRGAAGADLRGCGGTQQLSDEIVPQGV